MEENKQTQDQQLFDSIGQAKKKKKKRLIRTIVIIVIIVAAVLIAGTVYLKHQVKAKFGSTDDSVTSAEATVGSISTTVSGSGSLSAVDSEEVTIPSGVEVDEVKVSANDTVEEGDVIATLDSASIASAIDDVQSEIDDIDDQIASASSDTLDSSITAGVAGRVMEIYAQEGDSVSKCMADNGSLMVLSVDGYMAADIESDSLSSGDTVTVVTDDGTELDGTVESISGGTAVVLVSDDTTSVDEQITVKDSDGNEIGNGTLYIHNPIKVTGIGGTVSSVNVSTGDKVSSGTSVVTITDTSYTGTYDSLIQQRNDKEDELVELLQLQENSALTAPFSGTIITVDYDEDSDSSDTSSQAAAVATTSTSSDEDTNIVTMAPNQYMEVTISVDETDILSLEKGQTADITIDSLGDDSYEGTVTEINQEADSSSGVTEYQATVQLEKVENMLPGMTADVAIKIDSVDDAILIPVEALHQTSSTSYVYTSYDEETGEFGDEVEVVSGLSNSNYVEIKSGLEEGDTVYYTENSNGGFMGEGFDMKGSDFNMDDIEKEMGGDKQQMPSGGGGDSSGNAPSMPSGGGSSDGQHSAPSGGQGGNN